MATVVNDFLRRCAAKVAGKVQPLTVVLGNEGGDMDSIVGSIYFAMFLDQWPKWGIENPVPAINFPLEDLPLRRDVEMLFKEVGIDTSLLLSVHKGEALDRHLDLAALDAKIYLYDHNKLTGEQSAFGAQVVGVVDHHSDERLYTDLPSCRRVIKTVGSACTLVAEQYQISELDVPCPLLLDAPIVLDTVNFDPSQKKVTPEDVAMHQWLCRKMESTSYDATELYQKLSGWKNDVLSLTVAQNLRRDYKVFDFPSRTEKGVMVTGTSSVPCSCQEFEKNYSLDEVLVESIKFVKQRGLDVLIFAFAGKVDGKHSREVAFCARTKELEVFAPFIADASDGIVFSLISEVTSGHKTFHYVSYSLSDAAVSRKKLVPALRKFLAEGGTRSLL